MSNKQIRKNTFAVVISPGKVYDQYEDMAKKMGLHKWSPTDWDSVMLGDIVWVLTEGYPHPSHPDILVGVSDFPNNRQYIISIFGLKPINT